MSRRMAVIVLAPIIGGAALLALLVTYRTAPESPRTAAPAANAAPLTAPDMRGYQALVLLADPLVQDHLGLSEMQKGIVGPLVEEFLEGVVGLTALAQDVQSLSGPERAARWEQIRAQQSALVAAHDSRAIDVLSPAQRQRLGQLALRLRIEKAFYRADVIDELALSRHQTGQIAARRSELLAAASELQGQRRDNKLSAKECQDQIAKLRGDALAFYESLLTDSQRPTWQRLIGEEPPFTKDDLRWQLRRGGNRK